ncbi:MAG: universal stress protein [Dehalococcoidales bacterium]|nr:universal stress protein [Dehalococcoidales bacterium]
MFGKILVCLDGSSLAEQILPYVSAEASRFNSKVILFQVTPEPIVVSPGIPGAAPLPVQTKGMLKEAMEAEREAQAYLAEIAERLWKQGVPAETMTMPGRAGETIVGYAVNDNTGLIALATHGRSGLGRAVFGSVADFVLRESGLPILVIKPQETEAPVSLKPNPFEKILVCLDGSRLAEQILPYAQAQANRFYSKVMLLQVATVPTMALAGAGTEAAPASDQLVAEQSRIAEGEAGEYLKKVAQNLAIDNLEIVVLQGTPVGKAILDYADEQGIDLVCLATHGRSGLGRAVFGSVANQVLRESGLPILVIKPEGTKK